MHIRLRTIALGAALFIILGIAMDLVHEVGHAAWGIAAGGRLTYLKIIFIELYPVPAITSTFVLGHVEVHGLTTNAGQGLFLLGGSITTNLVAWLLGIILLMIRVGHKTQVAIKMFGLFGIFDLPFYVVFPRFGLQHWILLGGNTPEPLMGAQKLGLADLAFYILVLFTTAGLSIIYSRHLRTSISRLLREHLVKRTKRWI